MSSRGYSTKMSFAMMTSKKHEHADKIREEHTRNRETIAQTRYLTEESNRQRIKERDEISNALRLSSRLSLQAKEKLERKKSELKAKIRESIRKSVVLQLNRNDQMIEEQKKNCRIKKLQKLLGTDETDLNILENMKQELKIKKKMELEQIEENIKKKSAIKPSILGGMSFPKIDVGVTTDQNKENPNHEKDEGDGKPIEEQLKAHEERKLQEKEEELENKKAELLHFFGSETFTQMQNLPNDVIKKYLNQRGIETEIPHFPWIKEYKRFIEKCKQSEPRIRDRKGSYNLTEELNKAKRKEWWYRQKYKLMKALKSKLNDSNGLCNTKEFNLTKDKVNKLPIDDIDYNHMQATTISFEKIPLLKPKKNKETDEVTAETSIISYGERSNMKMNRSTNTGPDVILMLNDLKKSKKNSHLRELYEMKDSKESDDSILPDKFTTMSPNNAYKNIKKSSFKRSLKRDIGSLSQVMETQSQNPYQSLDSHLKKSKSSCRYTSAKKPQKLQKSVTTNFSNTKMDKFQRYRLENIDRIEKKITGFTYSKSKVLISKNPKKDMNKCLLETSEACKSTMKTKQNDNYNNLGTKSGIKLDIKRANKNSRNSGYQQHVKNLHSMNVEQLNYGMPRKKLNYSPSVHHQKQMTSFSTVNDSFSSSKGKSKELSQRQYPLPIPVMQKRFKNELKHKLEKKMIETNEKLEPQFKLSRIDIEDIINSKTLNGEVEGSHTQNYEDLLMRKIKDQRRIEYWNKRIKLDILKKKRSHSSSK
ncbi:unnamed protein product [Moneuplotes crassus]|uniref:Uncharacterized protein n=2 Tax=Euplotes crassus TaxID=5936 RepID=A0AAD1Y6W5_EUPCR|nr:unnamed protein product [Moneuplotes crassus]